MTYYTVELWTIPHFCTANKKEIPNTMQKKLSLIRPELGKFISD